MSTLLSRRHVLVAPPALLAGGLLATRPALAQGPPAAARGAIRLAGNENPLGPGPAARAALAAAAGDAWKYPMGEEMALRAMIAEREGLTPAHVLLGAGS